MKKYLMIFIAAAFFVGCSNGGDEGDEGTATPGGQSISLNAQSVEWNFDGTVATGSANSLTVTSSADWRLTGDTAWCTPSAKTGSNGATVTLTASENTTGKARSVNLYFICGDATQKLTVNQSPEGVVDYIKVEDSYSYPTEGGTLTVRVESNLDSNQCETSDDWIRLRPATTSTGEQWVQFYIDANMDFFDREGSVKMFPGTDFEKTIAIKQAKFIGVKTDDPIKYDVGPDAGKFTISAKANVDFDVSVTTANNWISSTLLSSSGTDVIEKTFEINYSECSFDRTGTFTLKPTSGVSINATITQVNPNPDLFDIPDAVFANRLKDAGYLLPDGDKWKLTYNGFNATSISITGQNYKNMESIEGIEKFVNLTTLRIEDCKLKKADVSKNTKITSLNLTYIPMEELILGDLNITTYGNNNYMYAYYTSDVRSQSFKASGSKLTTININHTSAAVYDEIEWVDITECPALTTLNCNRNGNKLKEIRVTQAQKDAYDAGTLKITTHANFDKTTGIVVK